MPRVKSYSAAVKVAGASVVLRTVIHVNAQGVFYCDVEKRFHEAAKGVFPFSGLSHHKTKPDHLFRCEANTMTELARYLHRTLEVFATPEVEETHVIRYHVAPDVHFAVGPGGEVFPNCYYPDTKWPSDFDGYAKAERGMFRKSFGYSLSVAAKAQTKKVVRYGEHETVKYDNYYKGGSHLGVDNPAQKLNSWTHVALPDNATEIPYTDEAALFFYDLLYSMAKLAKLVYDRTGDVEELQKTIASGGSLRLENGETP